MGLKVGAKGSRLGTNVLKGIYLMGLVAKPVMVRTA